jgi:light-regulated signal transduction histidine kinase (bacteriophytochrome)
MITDINYTPVPLLTIDNHIEKNNKSLDLSHSVLRSVSPIHIEYLRNMGVGATLTISLLQNQKLWGLIACHHYSPKVLPHYTRLSALLQGHFLTSQIAVRQTAEEFEVAQDVEKALIISLALLHENEDFIRTHFQSPELLTLAHASGAAIFLNGILYRNGICPPNQELADLMHFLAATSPEHEFDTDRLLDVYPGAEAISKYAAGVIYSALPSGTLDGIAWMRQEKIETINWAGNPHKAVASNEESLRLTPRKSFELWIEVVKNKSLSWRKSEINAASNFSYALQKHINFHLIRNQEDKNRILNEELKIANKELANLNWISTHDLKEPLRKIQIFASKVLDREDPDLSAQVKDSVGRMRVAAEKMQVLIEDILTYSKAGSMEKVFETVDLNTLLENVVAELRDNMEESNATITKARLPVLKIIPFQIQQLFVNLISNAIKFTKPGVRAVIDIAVSVEKGGNIAGEKASQHAAYHRISFEDNGIGFEKEYETRIFDIFQRLHPAHKYPGTGIGLAICKKIMENHLGFIQAHSEPDKGSVFSIYFPVE